MRKRTMVCALLGTLALGACGDSGEDTDTTEAGGGDFIAQADSICEEASAQISQINLEQGLDMTAEETAAKFAEFVPVRQEALEAHEALEVPEDAGAAWEEFLSTSAEYVQATEGQLAAFEGGAQAKIDKANAAAGEASDARQAAAEEAGLSSCASVLPDDDQAAAEEALLQFTTTNDPATSCEYENADAYVSEPYVEDGFGGIEKCTAEQKKLEGKLPTDIKVEETTGVDDTVAIVNYADVGGKFDGEPTSATLYYIDGGWRLYSINPAS
jgi:hypothetical protein